MADKVSKKVRSQVMRSIPSSGTKPELRLRYALVRNGLRGWRMHATELSGKPDFAFSKKKGLIFVDGCFWHACKRCCRKPKTNKPYWRTKFRVNKLRDKKNAKILSMQGWRVLHLWEHEVRDELKGCVDKIKKTFGV